MGESILTSTKKILGLAEDYTAFDLDIITHINSVFVTLNDLGVGPDTGYMIEDAQPTWVDFLGNDPRLNNVKTYVYLCVRVLFDPPALRFVHDAIKQQIQELEWRINAQREFRTWTPPPPPDPDQGYVYDPILNPI